MEVGPRVPLSIPLRNHTKPDKASVQQGRKVWQDPNPANPQNYQRREGGRALYLPTRLKTHPPGPAPLASSCLKTQIHPQRCCGLKNSTVIRMPVGRGALCCPLEEWRGACPADCPPGVRE